MHACSFEPRFDDLLIRAFHAPGANGPPGCLKGWVLHLRFALLQIRQMFAERVHVGVAGLHRPQISQYLAGTFMLERMQLLG
jgi:hypothetical protein